MQQPHNEGKQPESVYFPAVFFQRDTTQAGADLKSVPWSFNLTRQGTYCKSAPANDFIRRTAHK